MFYIGRQVGRNSDYAWEQVTDLGGYINRYKSFIILSNKLSHSKNDSERSQLLQLLFVFIKMLIQSKNI